MYPKKIPQENYAFGAPISIPGQYPEFLLEFRAANQLVRPDPLLSTTTTTRSEHPPADVEEIFPVLYFIDLKSQQSSPLRFYFFLSLRRVSCGKQHLQLKLVHWKPWILYCPLCKKGIKEMYLALIFSFELLCLSCTFLLPLRLCLRYVIKRKVIYDCQSCSLIISGCASQLLTWVSTLFLTGWKTFNLF